MNKLRNFIVQKMMKYIMQNDCANGLSHDALPDELPDLLVLVVARVVKF